MQVPVDAWQLGLQIAQTACLLPEGSATFTHQPLVPEQLVPRVHFAAHVGPLAELMQISPGLQAGQIAPLLHDAAPVASTTDSKVVLLAPWT